MLRVISEEQILSLMRFNSPFNYQTVHLCKHPHPLLPSHAHTHTHRETDVVCDCRGLVY